MRLSALTITIAVIVPILTACTPMPLASTARRAVSLFDERTDSVLTDALMAQVSAPGWCSALDTIASEETEYLLGVRLKVGSCRTEHGANATAVVAVDGGGMLYQLGTPSGLRFLLRRHPPTRSPLESPVTYAALALKLSGLLRWDQHVLERVEDAPDGSRSAFDSAGVARPTRVVEMRPHLAIVDVGAAVVDRVDVYRVVVLPDGMITVSALVNWRTRQIH